MHKTCEGRSGAPRLAQPRWRVILPRQVAAIQGVDMCSFQSLLSPFNTRRRKGFLARSATQRQGAFYPQLYLIPGWDAQRTTLLFHLDKPAALACQRGMASNPEHTGG